MKKFTLLLLLLVGVLYSCEDGTLDGLDLSEPITFTTDEFKRVAIEAGVDLDGDNEISIEEALAVTELDLGDNTTLESIYSADLARFVNMTTFRCDNTNISYLDVSENTALRYLYCYKSNISSLDLSNNTALYYLSCYTTNISTLDVSNNTALTTLDCEDTSISTLDVSNNTALAWLDCGSTNISSLDVSNNTALTTLRCYSTNISTLDVSNNTALYYLNCSSTNISTLDVSNNTALTYLFCTSCPNLSTLYLATGQTISTLGYTDSVTTIYYK